MRIDTKPLTVVLIRMMSVYLVARGVLESTRMFGNPGFWEQADTENKVMVLGSFLTPLVLAVILWLSSKKIAEWVAPDAKSCWLPEERALVSVGSFLIGLYWAITALRAFYSLHIYGWAQSYPWLVVLGGSILLMVGSNFMGRCYAWLRTAGLSHNKSSNTDAGDAGAG